MTAKACAPRGGGCVGGVFNFTNNSTTTLDRPRAGARRCFPTVAVQGRRPREWPGAWGRGAGAHQLVEEVDDLLDHVDGLDVLLAPDEALHAVVVPLAQELQQPQDRPRVRRQRWVQPQAPGRGTVGHGSPPVGGLPPGLGRAHSGAGVRCWEASGITRVCVQCLRASSKKQTDEQISI